MSTEPSEAYRRALAEAARHHAASKTYSGRLLRPHKIYLTALIRQFEIRSALDYGCGKGEQYRWVDHEDGKTLEQVWGFEVAKYDPAWPPYAAEPAGPFDLVICSHVLGGIPIEDHGWVIARLVQLATKAVFIAEKIGPIKKGVHGARRGMANGWQPEDWAHVIRLAIQCRFHAGTILPRIHLSTVERIGDEKICKRSILL